MARSRSERPTTTRGISRRRHVEGDPDASRKERLTHRMRGSPIPGNEILLGRPREVSRADHESDLNETVVDEAPFADVRGDLRNFGWSSN